MLVKRLLFLFLFSLLFSLCACQSAEKPDPAPSSVALTAEDFITFTDTLGNEVTVTAHPQTVAVLFSSFADVWTTAGGTIAVTVGEAVERGFAPDSALLVDSGSGHTTIDLETLIAAQPDFVIGTADYACQAEAVAFCREAGIPAAVFRVENVDDYLFMLSVCCSITGQQERYAEKGVAVKKGVDRLLAEVSEYARGTDAPEILFIRAGSSEKSTKAKTSDDTFAAAMLTELGARNIADTEEGLIGTLSLEAVLTADPDCLFITAMGDETAARDYMDSLLTTDGWKDLTCVREDRVYFLPKDLFHFKPNARWEEAYRYLADLLYPEMN